ncbi:MAG: RidA family protein [Chitinophagales bacterium]
MQQQIVFTKDAPAPIGPYSQAVKAGGMVYVSGQIAIDPATNQITSGSVEEEAKQVMKNLEAVLIAAGSDFSRIVKTGIFLKDMNDFAVVNTVYGSFFTGNFPARETVEVARLPKDVRVEISCIALCA